MYCPKCGQSQASAEVRFCSRCGFPLVVVSDLLKTGGMIPARMMTDESPGLKPISPRRRGVKKGAAALLVSIFLIPFFLILHEAIGLPGEFALFGVIGCIGSFLRIIYAALFEEGAPRQQQFAPLPQQFYMPPAAPHISAVSPEALPAASQQQQGTPVNNYRQPHLDTAELLHPPSVTDHTTRLLDKQSDTSER